MNDAAAFGSAASSPLGRTRRFGLRTTCPPMRDARNSADMNSEQGRLGLKIQSPGKRKRRGPCFAGSDAALQGLRSFHAAQCWVVAPLRKGSANHGTHDIASYGALGTLEQVPGSALQAAGYWLPCFAEATQGKPATGYRLPCFAEATQGKPATKYRSSR